MEINKHICFNGDKEPEVLDYLNRNGIAFKKGELISLDIYESNPHWPQIAEFVKERKLFCRSEAIFSKQELSSAEWLTLRSMWRNGYPQPECAFEYESITYSSQNLCKECGTGLVQTDAFRIKKAPNWGKRHFMMLNWVEDELFIDDIAKNILLDNGITGMSFREVKDKKGKEILPNVEQLIVPHILPEGIVPELPAINDINHCTCCGIPKYHPSGVGMLTFRRDIFDNAPDIVKTAEVFGWGHSAPRKIIVSQKFYQTIVKNQLDRSLEFEPIALA